MRLIRFSSLILLLSFASLSFAVIGSGGGGGGSSSSNMAIGMLFGTVSATQNDMNTLQSRGNTREGGITTGQLTSAWELAPFVTYRFTGTMYALHFRPSYFYQRQDGSGASGGYTYAVTGYTVFPMLRLYPLENDFMKFYMQIGLGYGQVSGQISEGANNHLKFGSGAFGSAVGLGAEFCYHNTHCAIAEGNYRYLNFERNIISSSSGAFAGNSLSQFGAGQEAEVDGNDLSVRMGGVMVSLGYAFYF